YAPLDQIDASNVAELQVVWRRPAVADELRRLDPDIRHGNNFRSTPLMVGGLLYASNGIGLVESMHPGSGATVWVQELPDGVQSLRGGSAARGLAYWEGGDDRRIISIRGDRLYAIDAESGAIVRDFGDDGSIDLRLGL